VSTTETHWRGGLSKKKGRQTANKKGNNVSSSFLSNTRYRDAEKRVTSRGKKWGRTILEEKLDTGGKGGKKRREQKLGA